ncbi:MAG: hypothetical protein U9R75_08375 [Candidatus Thermoplasmatota archaeon]|nr:hypothetical protein [Candidatus Thermoplasmatota archaeon]
MRVSSAGDHGVSDIPMRLLMAAVIMSMSFPVFWGAYDSLSEKMTVSSVERELGNLLEVVDDVMSGGEGSTLDVSISLSSWGSSTLEYVRVGGPSDNNDSSTFKAEYSISGYGRSFLALDPPIRMRTPDGYDLELQEGDHDLKIVNTIVRGSPVAEISHLN